ASAATASAASPAEGGDSPEWLLAPYLWAPDFKGTVGLGGITLPLDVRADEMLRDVDAGAMGLLRWTQGSHFLYLEGMGLAWSNPRFEAFYDQNVKATLIFAELGYGRHFRVDLPAIARGLTLVSPYVGLRYATLDMQIVRTERILDPVIGLLLRRRVDG